MLIKIKKKYRIKRIAYIWSIDLLFYCQKKIDKITVWENGNSENGKLSTSNFISGMYKAVPPLQEMFDMAGMQLPNYLKGEKTEEVSTAPTKDKEPKTSKE